MAKKKGARTKLREHFLSNIGRLMDSGEPREIAGGITEWARRVRELYVLKKVIKFKPTMIEVI